MKIRIYAILPDTAENTLDPVSGEFKVKDNEELGFAIGAVTMLYPDWSELSIERITREE